jgi:ferredoxin
MAMAAGSTTTRLVVDPVACDGIGMCAHLASDLVRLDSWGYAIVPERELEPREVRRAAQAVAGCPRKALLLDRRER